MPGPEFRQWLRGAPTPRGSTRLFSSDARNASGIASAPRLAASWKTGIRRMRWEPYPGETLMVRPKKQQTMEDQRLATLVSTYRPAIFRYLSRRVRPPSDIEDATQEVFARMLRRAQGEPVANVEGYLFQIAANLVRERGRSAAIRGQAGAIEVDPSFLGEAEVPSPERILEGREAYQRLIEAIQELPERTRTVFMLNRFDDMTAPEIARRLGMPLSTVEKAMMRALKHLKARVR